MANRLQSLLMRRLNNLSAWHVLGIMIIAGALCFSTGLNNPFRGDDTLQIVQNVPVHSISNWPLFFQGSTFYTGKGVAPLEGSYYRPLMVLAFSLLYSIFGENPFPFHLLQLLLAIGCAELLYLVLRYSFKPPLALGLALVFLVHPLNSQLVFAIPSMQEVLFFFFGILAIWLLLHYSSTKSLVLPAVALLLSLFAKETGLLCVVMAGLYMALFDRRRLLPFIGIVVLPLGLYFALKTHAVGVYINANIAPIDKLSFAERLLTAPSVMLLYIVKFIFPARLSSAYYWTYPQFSIAHVVIPLLIDVAVITAATLVGRHIKRRASHGMFLTYLFFCIMDLHRYCSASSADSTRCHRLRNLVLFPNGRTAGYGGRWSVEHSLEQTLSTRNDSAGHSNDRRLWRKNRH